MPPEPKNQNSESWASRHDKDTASPMSYFCLKYKKPNHEEAPDKLQARDSLQPAYARTLPQRPKDIEIPDGEDFEQTGQLNVWSWIGW